MSNKIHLIKLSVGSESVDNLRSWQEGQRLKWKDGLPRHITRMWPKRESEILNGGSIYWVIKGIIQCRQTILGFEEVRREDGIRRCAIILDPNLKRVAPSAKRPFQGWRYLPATDAPQDLGQSRQSDDNLPPEMSAALSEIGVL